MDIDLFGKSPIGKLVPISGKDRYGRSFDHFAYVPDVLPRTIDLSGETWNVVTAAGMALGRLDGEGRRLPNPSNLARPSIRAEAVSSSALEGTYTTLPQVLQSELFDDSSSSDVNEVLDYVRAAETGFRMIADGLPLSVNMIKRLHRLLMASDNKCPPTEKGDIRTRQNFIGPRPDSEITEAHFVPPPPGPQLITGMNEWEKWIHNQDINLLVRMAVGHYQFETLHPFFDGNGRIGRLVAILLLLHDGDLSVPLLNISPYLEAQRREYQTHLRQVSITGEFEPWVRFFCQGVKTQSEEAIRKIDLLEDIKQTIVEALHAKRVRGIAIRIADDIIGFPLLTPPNVAHRYGVTPQAATNALNLLASLGHLERVPWRSNRLLFAASPILDVIHG